MEEIVEKPLSSTQKSQNILFMDNLKGIYRNILCNVKHVYHFCTWGLVQYNMHAALELTL